MVKVYNPNGDQKTGRQGLAVYQGHYGQQMRRIVRPKTGITSKPQTAQRQRFNKALAFRKGLSLDARRFLDGYALAHRVVDSLGVPLTWDKLALKICIEAPRVTILF